MNRWPQRGQTETPIAGSTDLRSAGACPLNMRCWKQNYVLVSDVNGNVPFFSSPLLSNQEHQADSGPSPVMPDLPISDTVIFGPPDFSWTTSPTLISSGM